MIQNTDFDLLFLDMDIENGSGIGFLSEVRMVFGEINVVAMTRHPNRELEKKVREQRIIYYLVNPMDLREVRSIIDHIKQKTIENHSGTLCAPTNY